MYAKTIHATLNLRCFLTYCTGPSLKKYVRYVSSLPKSSKLAETSKILPRLNRENQTTKKDLIYFTKIVRRRLFVKALFASRTYNQ